MAASDCSTLRVTKTFAQPSLKGWRREKKLNLIGTINPEFKDLAQTWGWKMITEHEKKCDHQVGTAARSCSRASVVEKLRTA
jgi:hypothetical protein